jgi:hypothetical protein
MRIEVAAVSLLLLALLPASAHACPDCAIGRQARLRFVEEHVLVGLAGVSLPLLLPVVASVFIHGRGKKR